MLLPSLPPAPSPAFVALCAQARPSTPSQPGSPGQPRSTLELPPVWMMLVAQLDPCAFDFTPEEIAALFCVVPEEARRAARELWPGQKLRPKERWRLSFEQAVLVIYRMARRARKLDPQALLEKMYGRGLTGELVRELPLVSKAQRIILLDRDRRAGLVK